MYPPSPVAHTNKGSRRAHTWPAHTATQARDVIVCLDRCSLTSQKIIQNSWCGHDGAACTDIILANCTNGAAAHAAFLGSTAAINNASEHTAALRSWNHCGY